MSNTLKEISVEALSFNPFTTIGKDWYLITSGTPDDYNTMTASWGTMGIFWGKPVVNSFVRPQRYTHEFMEKNDLFTLTFFGDGYRDALNFCGSKSGRDFDKAKECGLTPVALSGSTSFAEAKLVLVCKKVYRYTIKPEEMIEPSLDQFYKAKDYHDCYYGEIIAAYQSEA